MIEGPRGIHAPKGPTGTWVPTSPLQAGMEATGSSQKVLRHLYRTLGKLCIMIEGMPGATRPTMDYVAAELWEAGVLLGEVTGSFATPTSAWPEGEAQDEIDVEQRDDI